MMQTATATPSAPVIARPCVEPDAEKQQRRFWSEEELQVLRDYYLDHGMKECEHRLPLRSRGAIMEKAHHLGLLRSPHAKPAESTPAIDDAIRRVYSLPLAPSNKTNMDHYRVGKLAERIGRTRQWIYARALKLKVARAPMAMKWCEEEIRIIEEAEGLGVQAISNRLKKAGYHRTPSAIRGWTERHGLVLNDDDPDIYAGLHVAKLLGVDNRSVVRWIESGRLKADRDRPETNWRIHKNDLREFMIEHQAAWDHRRVQQQWWLIEILTGRIARVV